MKILYKPFAIIAGIIAGKLGQKLFSQLWAKIDDAPPPKPEVEQTSWWKVIGAGALQGATMAGIRAAVDRGSVKSFHHLTGIWPGPKTPEESAG
jgi:hypothetical protein